MNSIKKKTVVLMKVNDIIPEHSLDIATDFEKIKKFCPKQKEK